MKERTIQVVLHHLRELEDDFWGTFSIRLREGDAVLITEERTVKLDDDGQKHSTTDGIE